MHDHRVELRRRRFGQRDVLQGQCVECLRPVGKAVPVTDFPLTSRRVPPWEPKPRQKRLNSRKRSYVEYLQSAKWKALRAKILERDNWTCRLCGEPATEVHHLTYARLGHELPDDLLAACKPCNLDERCKSVNGSRP